MANRALAILESALRDRKLDRTLTTALPPLERVDPAACVPSGLLPLDACLRGGLPRGQLSEMAAAPVAGVHARTAGRTTVLLQMLAAATQRGELAALIDTSDCLDVASAVTAGVDLDRLLWVRGAGLAPAASGLVAPAATAERMVERAVKALGLVLQAGGFGLVVLDVADVLPVAVKRLPFTTWLRVQRMVEGSETACVLLVPEPLARSAGGVTLSLAGRATWTGTAERSRQLTGLDVRVRMISPRRQMDGEASVQAVFTG